MSMPGYSKVRAMKQNKNPHKIRADKLRKAWENEVVKMKPTTERKESINYCLHDYKNHHYWEKVGVENGKIVYQCSQCRKCSYEEINMIGRLL